MKLAKLLQGTSLIRDDNFKVVVQTIRNMSLAFLTCPAEHSFDTRFENPMKAIRATNRNYGHLKFTNTSAKDVLVAPQVAVMTKYPAQNHAMSKSAVVRAGRSKDFNDAGCVQGSQTGLIRGTGEETLRFMPVSIREQLLSEAGSTGNYSHLYTAVEALGQRTRTQAGRYLNVYFEKSDASTQEFIAHFERPDKMIGVVVMIDNEIVAIDKFPSYTYGVQVWDALIRDCYGSLAIEAALDNKEAPDWFGDARLPEIETTAADHLLARLDKMEHNRSEMVIARLNELMEVEFSEKLDDRDDPYQSTILKSDGYIGQLITSAGFHLMVSLIRKEKFDAAKLRKVREATQAYREKAAEQREFSL